MNFHNVPLIWTAISPHLHNDYFFFLFASSCYGDLWMSLVFYNQVRVKRECQKLLTGLCQSNWGDLWSCFPLIVTNKWGKAPIFYSSWSPLHDLLSSPLFPLVSCPGGRLITHEEGTLIMKNVLAKNSVLVYNFRKNPGGFTVPNYPCYTC